ncbi:hypothetical protein Pelo_1762 [Pelomyxa schiedti]|nr:hypothetical protein Pelo_1762 [Pelomyxa schiedti]
MVIYAYYYYILLITPPVLFSIRPKSPLSASAGRGGCNPSWLAAPAAQMATANVHPSPRHPTQSTRYQTGHQAGFLTLTLTILTSHLYVQA